MNKENFEIVFENEKVFEKVSYSFEEKTLFYDREIQDLVRIHLELQDGFQRFVNSVFDYSEKSKEKKDGGIKIKFCGHLPQDWRTCAEELVKLLNENTIFSNLADPYLFEKTE